MHYLDLKQNGNEALWSSGWLNNALSLETSETKWWNIHVILTIDPPMADL